MSLSAALAVLVGTAPFRRRIAPVAAAPVPRPRAQAPLPPLQDELSYEPYRDYRPGGRAGDPYRPF